MSSTTDLTLLLHTTSGPERISSTPVTGNTPLLKIPKQQLKQPGTIAAFVLGSILMLVIVFAIYWFCQRGKRMVDRHSEHYNLEKGEGGEWIAKQTRRRFKPQFRRKSHHQPRLTVTRIGPPRHIDPPKNMSVTNINAHMGKMVQMPMTLKSVTKPSTATKTWPPMPDTPTTDKSPFLHSRSGSNSDSPVLGDKLFEGAQAGGANALVHQIEIISNKENKILRTYSILQKQAQQAIAEPPPTRIVTSYDRASNPHSICDFFSPDEVKPCPSPPRKDSLLVKVAYSPNLNNSGKSTSPPLITNNLDAIDRDLSVDGYRRSVLVITSPNGTNTVHKPFEIQIPPSASPPQKYSPPIPQSPPTIQEEPNESTRSQKPVELVDPQKTFKRKLPPKPLLNLAHTSQETTVPPEESPPLSPLIFTFDDTPQPPPADNTAWQKRVDSENNEHVQKTVICAEVKMGPCTPDSIQTTHPRHPRFSYESVSTINKPSQSQFYKHVPSGGDNGDRHATELDKRTSEPVMLSANVTNFENHTSFLDSSALYSPTFGDATREIGIDEFRQKARDMHMVRPQTIATYF